MAIFGHFHLKMITWILNPPAWQYKYGRMKPPFGLFMKYNEYFSNWFFATYKYWLAHPYFYVQFHVRELSNEVLYDILSQGASKLPQLGDLDFPLYLIKADF